MKKKNTKKSNKIIIAVIALAIIAVIVYYAMNNTMKSSQTVPTNEESVIVSSYMDLSSADAKALIDSTPGLVIIDVSPNYAQGHLPGAINYYVGDGSLDAAIPTLDKNAKYLVYCHVDSAARLGAQKLVDAGFTMVYRLKDNYSGWVAAGYSTEK